MARWRFVVSWFPVLPAGLMKQHWLTKHWTVSEDFWVHALKFPLALLTPARSWKQSILRDRSAPTPTLKPDPTGQELLFRFTPNLRTREGLGDLSDLRAETPGWSERSGQTGSSWRDIQGNSYNHCVQPGWAERHLWECRTLRRMNYDARRARQVQPDVFPQML